MVVVYARAHYQFTNKIIEFWPVAKSTFLPTKREKKNYAQKTSLKLHD